MPRYFTNRQRRTCLRSVERYQRRSLSTIRQPRTSFIRSMPYQSAAGSLTRTITNCSTSYPSWKTWLAGKLAMSAWFSTSPYSRSTLTHTLLSTVLFNIVMCIPGSATNGPRELRRPFDSLTKPPLYAGSPASEDVFIGGNRAGAAHKKRKGQEKENGFAIALQHCGIYYVTSLAWRTRAEIIFSRFCIASAAVICLS